MNKYRKKPLVVEAVQFFNGSSKPNTINNCVDFIGNGTRKVYYYNGIDKILIHPLKGDMLADDGDWVIKGISGEFYPCKPDIFAKTYEKVEE